ncbi:MAG: recombinase family protein [Vicinamibacterales bacterium]
MIVAVDYARYSSEELQDERSILDQQRGNEAKRARDVPEAEPIARHFEDAGISGASMINRPGLQALLRSAARGEFQIVIAESLDRLSRDQADAANIFKLLSFHGVRLITSEEGEIDEMVIGFKGTMSAMFLKGLAAKTRRGLLGQVERGFMAGGLSYGYRVTEVGTWAVVPEQAAVIVRICSLYADGVSPLLIAKRLNTEGVPGPHGCPWSPSTIHGHARRGTGILNNELYVGRMVWPRQRFVKDPRTGRRVARLVPEAERRTYPRLHLRILDDALWARVKARQAATRRLITAGPQQAHRGPYLFSQLTKCGVCGGGFSAVSRDQLRCFNKVKRGTCTNTRVIARLEVERRVLTALQQKFLADPVAFEAFSIAFVQETNRLRAEEAATRRAAPQELAAINRRSKDIMELLLRGFTDEAWKVELAEIERRRRELEAEIASTAAEPVFPALHPNMATIYRQKVEQLAAALDHPDEGHRAAARDTLRGFITAIVIPAGDGLLRVHGDLGKMLTAAGGASHAAAVEDVGCGGRI